MERLAVEISNIGVAVGAVTAALFAYFGLRAQSAEARRDKRSRCLAGCTKRDRHGKRMSGTVPRFPSMTFACAFTGW